jgi:hypothetical protein
MTFWWSRWRLKTGGHSALKESPWISRFIVGIQLVNRQAASQMRIHYDNLWSCMCADWDNVRRTHVKSLIGEKTMMIWICFFLWRIWGMIAFPSHRNPFMISRSKNPGRSLWKAGAGPVKEEFSVHFHRDTIVWSISTCGTLIRRILDFQFHMRLSSENEPLRKPNWSNQFQLGGRFHNYVPILYAQIRSRDIQNGA